MAGTTYRLDPLLGMGVPRTSLAHARPVQEKYGFKCGSVASPICEGSISRSWK